MKNPRVQDIAQMRVTIKRELRELGVVFDNDESTDILIMKLHDAKIKAPAEA